ncbi:engB [Symbiodinium sp. CCMP2456]|nr:engB [Symbiodinium sp. CCMP2456]
MRVTPTILLMFQSNDVDPASISSMLGWRVPDHDTSEEPDRIPLLCRYFQADTLSQSVLGVLLCSPAERLGKEHHSWLQKRISTLSLAAGAGGGPGAGPLALAASLGAGPGKEPSKPLKPNFLRMDRPLKEQCPVRVCFGAAVDLEAAEFGPVPGSEPEEAADQPKAAEPAADAAEPGERQRMIGCLFLHTDVGPPHSKTKDGIQLSVWRAFAKALREVSGSGLEVDLIAAKPCRYHTAAAADMQPSKPQEPSSSPLSLVLFQLERPSFSAERIAEAVCRGFASEADSKASFCRGRLARHRPRELLLLHGTRFGAQAHLWRSLAPGSEAVLRLGGPIPWDFLAALDFFEVPRFVDVKCVQIGASGLLRAEWALAQSGSPSLGSLEWKEKADPPKKKAKAKAEAEAEAEGAAQEEEEAEAESSEDEEVAEGEEGPGPPQLWGIIRARRRRWADETDSDEGQKKVVRMAHADSLPPESATSSLPEASPKAQSPGPSSASPSNSIRPGQSKFATSFGSPKSQMLSSSSCSPKHQNFPSTDQETSEATGTHSPSPEPEGPWGLPATSMHWKTFVRKTAEVNDSRVEETCEPRGRSTTPAGALGARAECPPLAKLGICFEGAARAEPSVARARRSNDPGPPSQDEESANVKRSLGQSMEQVLGLLAEARTLGLVDEVRSAEKRLKAAMLQRLGPAPSPSPSPSYPAPACGSSGAASGVASVPRSRALSRASSCDSFFDGEALRFVLAPSPSNTPGDITQSNSPRSHCHTPGGAGAYENDYTQYQQYQAYHGIRGSHGSHAPSAASIDSALRKVEQVAEALQVPQVPQPGSQWVQAQAASETFEEGPAPANAWQDALAPLLRAPAPSAPLRRRSKPSAESGPSLGFMWHSSPFAISRTPNIHTPVSHHSPARSPTSFSGYCSPIPGFPSGVASPNRRSGYSSPSTGLNAAAFFTGAAAAATQSGLMRRLMSLREARGEEREEDSEWSSEDPSDGEGDRAPPDLLELLLKHAERVAPRRGGREPRSLCLDLSSELLPVRLRGLLPCYAIPFLNAWVQALLACSPLCHLLAQVSWQKQPHQPHQRPAYNCLMQLAWEFYGHSELRGASAGSAGVFNRLQATGDHAVDAAFLAEPLLRRFERGKSVQEAPVFPDLVGPDMFSCFLRFFLGELHDECKWPTLSAVPYQHEDSPMMRIFGGLVRKSSHGRRVSTLGDGHAHTDVAPFLLLHLDLADPFGDPKTPISVEAAVEQLLTRQEARFLRLPPFLLLHLHRFRTGSDGLPDRVNRKCRIGLEMELEEATGYTLRSVTYQLRSAICHYGEVPEGGAYKAFALHCEQRPENGQRPGPEGPEGSWHVLDDAAVRCKKDIQEIIDSEGHHACLLMFRRQDTKTVNLRLRSSATSRSFAMWGRSCGVRAFRVAVLPFEALCLRSNRHIATKRERQRQMGAKASLAGVLSRQRLPAFACQRGRAFAETKKRRPLRPKEELLRDATHHDVPVRRKAVKDLGRYPGDPEAIAALAKALGDEDVAVQLAAQGAMSKVADIGDPRTVQATLERVSSTCEWTRIAALSTLADITGKFGHATRGTALDLQVEEAVKSRLTDEDWGVWSPGRMKAKVPIFRSPCTFLDGGSGRRGSRIGLRAGAVTDTLNVTEVYRLLKQAPTTRHALQLASRLRKAARDGKRTKEGRMLDPGIVDEALDVLLENNARLRIPVKKVQSIYDEDEDEDDEELSNPFAKKRRPQDAPWAEEAFPEASEAAEAGDPTLLAQAAAAEEAEDRAEEFGRATAEQFEERKRSPEPQPQPEPKAPPRWKSGSSPETETENEEDDGDVPYELWEQVISKKFNVVDRVWKAPTSTDLPRVPKLSEDAMVPENAWLRMPHIAVNGMTNCGKSSLINHVVRWNYAAKASSRAGRTTSIDFYVVNNRFVLVDLPGYPDPEEMAHQGVLKRWEAVWEDLVLRYLQMCEEGVYDLRLMMHLQQSHKKPSRACRRFVQELQERKLPMLLIMTKDDHLVKPQEQRNPYATQMKKTLQLEGPHIHYTSKKGLAMARNCKNHVQKWIRRAVTAESAEDVKTLLKEKWENRTISAPKKTAEEKQAKIDFWKARYKKMRKEKKAKRRGERATLAALARAAKGGPVSGGDLDEDFEDEDFDEEPAVDMDFA